MSEERHVTPPDEVGRFIGALLMAIGGLIASLCGLCTLLVGGVATVEFIRGGNGRDFGDVMALVVMVGGLPTLIGLGLVFWGRSLRRNTRQ